MADTSKKSVSSSGKARKSRNELIRATLGVYLKQKNYSASEKFRKSDLVLTQSAKQFVFGKMIQGDVSRVNSFLYSNVLCLSSNHAIVDQQFSKFVQFVQNQKDPVKAELSNLFGPLLCHLYIELLKGREWKPACDFLRNHAHLIAPIENLNAPLPNKVNGCSVISNYHNDSTSFPMATTQILYVNESTGNPVKDQFKELVQSLSLCLRMEALENVDNVAFFRSAKYEVELSLNSVNVLKKYLEKYGHVIILHIFHTWLHIEISDFVTGEDDTSILNVKDIVDDKSVPLENGIEPSRSKTAKPSDAKSQEELKSPEKKKLVNNTFRKLKHSVSKVQRLDVQTRSFKLSDPEKKLCCASMDMNECHLVAGYESSIIKLWQLNQTTCLGRNMFRTFNDRECKWNEYYSSDSDCSSSENEEDIISRSCPKILGKKSRQANYEEQKSDDNSFNESGGVSLFGHSKGVTDILFSEYHPLIMSSSKDQTMRVWKAKDYSCAGVYRGHNGPIWCLSENSIGMYVATGSRDLTARLWSLDREAPLITYVGHTQDIDCIAFHPNGNYLATGSTDLSVRLWCVTSGKLLRVFTDCRLPVSCISFSPDGKYLAAAGEETKVRIFDLAGSSQISELKDHTSPITSIAWNAPGNKFATCCTDGSLRLYDVSKIGVEQQSTQSSSTSPNNKILSRTSGCSRAVKILFNNTGTITCIGSS